MKKKPDHFTAAAFSRSIDYTARIFASDVVEVGANVQHYHNNTHRCVLFQLVNCFADTAVFNPAVRKRS